MSVTVCRRSSAQDFLRDADFAGLMRAGLRSPYGPTGFGSNNDVAAAPAACLACIFRTFSRCFS